ncbi:hypothetical protein AFZ27_12125 [Listeria monocytogenes]|uniref:phage tail spike protein n=1 Tax=Listeria monocytogenes TaxID=1639 RepID=UPI000BE1336D|nr:phage tail spike protein [Listeria monocytogenes]PDK52559.1 hypothetical protein AFZ27_12125 [Listeria monocytogenes]PDK54168.1 hypothetical protein AFZ28_12695 [Listeria monocytogenes]PDK58334.1 hypothetical protein AFZ26_12830 [Listeria monocytogenes]PDK61618.1 hypothetical protein AFZ25_11230 [Listeria monocytogenes]
MLLILDENKEIVKSISADSTNGTHYFNDSHTEKVIDFDSTYEFSVSVDDESSKYLTCGNYVMLQDLDDDTILFKIIEVQDIRDDKSPRPQKRIVCENVFIFDLNNVIVPDRVLTDTNIGPVLTYILGGSGWIPQETENVGAVATFELTGYVTAQEALHQACAAFDCEVKFYVKTYQGRIVGYYCKVAKEFGENEGVRVESGVGIKGITRKALFTNIKTALIPLGATQADGTQLTISSINGGLNYIFNDEANKQYNPSGTGYLMAKMVNENITNATALKQWGTLELRKLSSPSYQYEVSILMLEQVYGFEAHRVRKGSHVRVVDHEMNPPVTVDARVIELNISYSDMAKSTCVIGDFIEVNSATPAIINQLRQNQQVATDAKKTAVIAGGDAAEASQKADAASQDATDAKQKADNAKQSADQAQETANQANNAANQANTAAQNALTSANGKNKNYYGIMVPVDPQEGDRWFKSVNGEEVQTFIYSSGKWEPITLAPENLGTIYAEDGVIGSLDAGKIIAASLAVISANLGDVTAGSINFGNGTFKVDTEGNLTAKNANLTNGTFSTDYTIPVIGGNPPIYATGSMGVGSGGLNATDKFTQGGKNYTREITLDGNGLIISIREGNNPATSITLDAVNSGLYFGSKASGISFAGSGTSNGTDIDTYGNVVAQSNALTWNVRDADGTNALTVPMSSRHAQYGYILTPRHIKAGNMVLSKDHSISSLDGQTIYFNSAPGGARVDIACKSLNQSSLLSMKENLTTIDLDEALQAILDTDIRQYNFKGEKNTHTTFIIDDVNEEKEYHVDPHFLSETGDGRDDGSIIGYLMLAIKKLKQEIDELKAKID